MSIDNGREFYIMNKALAVAILAMERQPEYQSWSDLSDMKMLLELRIDDDFELEMYMRSARIAVTGEIN